MSLLAEGQAWTVVQGDCLDVLLMLGDKSVAHVITDPPYEAEAHTLQRRVNRDMVAARDGGGSKGRSRSPLVCAPDRRYPVGGCGRNGASLRAVDLGLLPGGGRDEVV